MIEAGCAPQFPNEIQPTGQDEYATLQGDKKPGRLAYCLTVHPDGFAHGNFISHKTGIKGKWISSQSNKKLSKEEKEAFLLRVKQADADRQIRKEKRYAQAAIDANDLWLSIPACKEHPYLSKKSIGSHFTRINGENLIIPLYNEEKLVSYQSIDHEGIKLYQTGGKKSGSYFKFGEDGFIICIGEGFATCASVFEATGYCTYAAMDVHNILDVAQYVRKRNPKSLIIICSDSDQWRTNSKGILENIGVIKGKEAALKIGGFECHPEFPVDDIDCRKDFNDLHQAEGLTAVRAVIDLVIDSQPDKEDPPEIAPEYYTPTIDENGDLDLSGDMELPFRVLGHNEGLYYYFPFGLQQIFSWPAPGHSMNNLLQLASLQEWKDWGLRTCEERLSAKEIPIYAFDTMKGIAEKRGVFQEEDRVRGCGAWIDAGRVVLHCGDKLLVDGELTSPKDICGRYVYAAAAQRFKHNADPLSNKEANALREICCMPTWENPLSGLLLAGWLVIAPVCAALEWRPHIWLRGEAGSGKSTILNQIIKKVLHNISYDADGGTTESSLREGLGYDARPVIYDEAEGNGNKPSLMDGVLALAKLSSTGGRIGKRGQKGFRARSSFCFSAINPPVKDFASETRISMLDLKKNISPNAQKHFANLEAAIRDTLTPDYGRRMLARTVKNLPILLQNIKTFKKAATIVIKNARAADQVSAMLGGLYMLTSTKLVTDEEAEKWISERDWTQHTAIAEESDPERLLHHIATSIVHVKGKESRDFTIGTLIACAIGKGNEIGEEAAKLTLRQYSILARKDGIFIGNKNQNMAKILGDTDWAINWNKTLARLSGAKAVSKQYFGAADNQRAMKIPPEIFYGEKPDQPNMLDETEIPFD